MDLLKEALSKQYTISGWKEQRPDLHFFKVEKAQARDMIAYLKDHQGFGHLVFFTTVDHMEEGHFTLLYMLHSFEKKLDLGVQVDIGREGESMDSIHKLWPAAATYQQEMREMFGIEFPGSPGLNENFALEGWEDKPPMRRDFDSLEYSEKTYYPRPGRKKYDTRQHMKEKLYPSEAETW